MIERFYEKVSPEPNSGCWLWTACVDGRGYGLFGIGPGKNERAHRASWKMHKGPIPAGMIVCHRCDMPGCVNPDHLFLGTHADNMADRDAKGRKALGVKNGRSRLTSAIVQTIRDSSASERKVAGQLGISRGTVNAVRSGRTWSHC